MSNDIADKELGAAVLESIQSGAYPDSEAVASANLTEGALQHVTLGLREARDKVKEEIKALSRSFAPDVDDWIQRATKLQTDIESSRATGRGIIQAKDELNTLRSTHQDAQSKHDFLDKELQFSHRLEQTLIQVKEAGDNLRAAQHAASRGNIVLALEGLTTVNEMLLDLGPPENFHAVDLLLQRSSRLKEDIKEAANIHWNAFIRTNRETSSITIRQDPMVDNSGASLTLEGVTTVLEQLQVLDPSITRLSRDFDSIILKPLLARTAPTTKLRIGVSEGEIRVSSQNDPTTAIDVLDDIAAASSFIQDNFPSKISVELSEILLPMTLHRLIPTWLTSSVPVSINDMSSFEDLLRSVSSLANNLSSKGWSGVGKLLEWTEQAPTVWLAKRRESSLMELRKHITIQIKEVKTVERVETQMVSSKNALVPTDAENQDWDSAWNEEADHEHPSQPQEQPAAQDDDEDASAWEVDDEPGSTEDGLAAHDGGTTDSKAEGEHDESDAWGWGDDKDASQPSSPVTTRETAPQPKVNGHPSHREPEAREVTLKETFNVTLVPDEIRDMILQTIQDAESLRQSTQSSSPIAPAALGLYSLPALILAGYRALAPTYYQTLPGGNMYLYNDCLRLSSELTSLNSTQATKDAQSSYPESSRPTNRMKLPGEISSVESFGRRAYGAEMDSQRTILRDLLDGAQGFANCTENPYKGECENAISMTSDRLREIARQWSSILSRSALLQSLGSLLTTILNKMIVDIEDMSDIGAEESTQLRAFFNEISKLSDMFVQEGPDGEQADTVHVYTPDWFKFQYLSEILESSLVDITNLWEEGMLKMDFEANEVVDLIEALFAESTHRKNAIRRIRAG